MRQAIGIILLFIFLLIPTRTLAQTAKGCPHPSDISGNTSNNNGDWGYAPGDVQQFTGSNYVPQEQSGWVKCTVDTTTGAFSWQATTERTASNTGASGRSFFGTPTGNWFVPTYPEHRNTLLQGFSRGQIGMETYLVSVLGNVINDGIFYTWEEGAAENAMGTVGGTTGISQPATWKPGGLTGSVSNLISTVYTNPPASSGKYIEYIAKNIGLPNPVPQAYAAQGTGFNSLNPIIDLWKLTRNLAYMFFAVIFVVLGLMVMLRYKIDPKTVVSVQNSLPRIITTIILITFSYPIVGFTIDIMYVLIAVIFSVAKNSNLLTGNEIQLVQTAVESQNIFQSVGLLTGIASNVGQSLNAVLQSIFLLFGVDAAGIPGAGGLIKSLGGLIISIMIIRALFQTFIQLLFAYGGIIFGAILGPIAILPDAIPGQHAFTDWIKMILSSVLVFPMVVVLLVMGQIFSSTAFINKASGISSGTFFAPPLIGIGDASSFKGIMALLIILLLPATTQMAQDLLGTKPFKYGAVWDESFKWIKGKASSLTKIS